MHLPNISTLDCRNWEEGDAANVILKNVIILLICIYITVKLTFNTSSELRQHKNHSTSLTLVMNGLSWSASLIRSDSISCEPGSWWLEYCFWLLQVSCHPVIARLSIVWSSGDHGETALGQHHLLCSSIVIIVINCIVHSITFTRISKVCSSSSNNIA